MSFVKMAEILGVAEGTVRRKVSSLIEDGTIRVSALCNPYMVGFDAPAFVGINVERKTVESLARRLATMPEVQFVAITTGPYEIIIQVVSPSNEDLFNFLMDIGKLEGIINTHTFLMLNIYKQTWNLEGAARKNMGRKRDKTRKQRKK